MAIYADFSFFRTEILKKTFHTLLIVIRAVPDFSVFFSDKIMLIT